MGRGIWLLALLVIVAISLGFFTFNALSKDEQIEKRGVNLDTVSEKIDEVLNNQRDIIARLEDIRAQQDIIRVRASRR